MELYEFAKQFDVIVIFAVLYGFGIGSLVYWVMEFCTGALRSGSSTGKRKRQQSKKIQRNNQ